MTGAPTGEPAVGKGAPAAAGRDEPVIKLRAIRKRFGYREALRGVDLEVRRRECVALFGPNGAGKSTLLRIIATQWRPSSGEGRVFGRDLHRDATEIRRRTGAVFHQSFLRPELTLDENLRFAAGLYGIPYCRAGPRCDELLERLGLDLRRRDFVRTFSQGMTKRANIVRSLIHEPELWLLDEPFSGLDPAGRELLGAMLRDFRQGGGTVVLVTHQQEIGRELSDRALDIDHGVLRPAATREGREP